ncbi:MAG: twin-arginine translocase subunit TatC, partial [Actinomycetota bacterium]|nr:twin-arginine translocase subunit TatC [Actinomycetota bacterium]
MARLRRLRQPEGRMSLGDHFRELRNRVLIAALAASACAVVGWVYYEQLFDIILAPLREVAEERGDDLVAINFGASLTEPFSMQLRVSMFVGIVLSSPVWIWQIWGFLLPGLTKQERRTARWFFAASVPLFFAGCVLAGWALPRTVAVLLSFTPEGAANIQDVRLYLSFILYFIVAFGVAFLLPVIMVGLNTLHILPVRLMLSGWRVAVMLILVFSAFVTPDPSAWTMLALATPMVILYFAAVGVSAILERRRRKADP